MNQYLNLVAEVLNHGTRRTDRTGVGTISLFGTQTRYDLAKGFPLLTTKYVNFESVKKELFWFLRGETNIETLGCGIWNEWASLNGECGPIYGKQWRRWESTEVEISHGKFAANVEANDQIATVVESIKTDPYSRRHIVSAWNIADLPKMALPPCHVLFQFYAHEDGKLDLQLYQRSADIALGVPFNIASYSLLLCLVAKATDRTPGCFIHTIGDAHIYENHVEGLVAQLMRDPLPLPTIKLQTTPDFSSPDKWNYQPEDVELVAYQHQGKIKFDIAV